MLASVSNFLYGVSFSLFIHFPGFLSEIGADAAEVGWIYGFTALTAIGIRPAVGAVMDRNGRRVVILAGNLLNVEVIGLYFTIDGLGVWVYVVRIVHGLSEALLFTSLFTYAADHVPERRLTQGLGVFGVSGMLPISVGVYWETCRSPLEATRRSSRWRQRSAWRRSAQRCPSTITPPS